MTKCGTCIGLGDWEFYPKVISLSIAHIIATWDPLCTRCMSFTNGMDLGELPVYTVIIISAMHIYYIMWLKWLSDSSGREWDENGMDYGFRMT